MPKFFLKAIVFLLLLGAGYGLATIQAARAIPWECSDWQAFAHADRPTAILESLAENRGKTLYCGIDQSDTFSKAETWQAGKDRNERDDTIYSGERGIFRGFIAAQEGWLTEGESGITGVSIDRIFEFPREKKKRRRYKTVVIEEREVPAAAGRTVRSPNGPTGSIIRPSRTQAERYFRDLFLNNPPTFDWESLAQTDARTHCLSLGYTRAVNAATVPFTHTAADPQGWGYTADRNQSTNGYEMEAYQTRQWTATCQKTKRRRR